MTKYQEYKRKAEQLDWIMDHLSTNRAECSAIELPGYKLLQMRRTSGGTPFVYIRPIGQPDILFSDDHRDA